MRKVYHKHKYRPAQPPTCPRCFTVTVAVFPVEYDGIHKRKCPSCGTVTHGKAECHDLAVTFQRVV